MKTIEKNHLIELLDTVINSRNNGLLNAEYQTLIVIREKIKNSKNDKSLLKIMCKFFNVFLGD